MGVLAHRGALGAVGAHVERAVPAGLLADPHAVLDLGDDRAADRAVGADGLDARHVWARRPPAPAAGRTVPAGGRDRGEAPDGEAGAPEESAPVHPVLGGRGQDAARGGAAGRLGALLPQHGGSLLRVRRPPGLQAVPRVVCGQAPRIRTASIRGRARVCLGVLHQRVAGVVDPARLGRLGAGRHGRGRRRRAEPRQQHRAPRVCPSSPPWVSPSRCGPRGPRVVSLRRPSGTPRARSP